MGTTDEGGEEMVKIFKEEDKEGIIRFCKVISSASSIRMSIEHGCIINGREWAVEGFYPSVEEAQVLLNALEWGLKKMKEKGARE